MANPKIRMDLAPPEPFHLDVGGETITLRPFTMLDENWLVNYLDGEDLFGGDCTNAVGAFLHQMDLESRKKFDKVADLDTLSLTKVGEWREAARVVAEKASAEQIDPIVKSLITLREKCLPELAQALKKEGGDEEKKFLRRKLILTGISSSVLTALVVWQLCLKYLG